MFVVGKDLMSFSNHSSSSSKQFWVSFDENLQKLTRKKSEKKSIAIVTIIWASLLLSKGQLSRSPKDTCERSEWFVVLSSWMSHLIQLQIILRINSPENHEVAFLVLVTRINEATSSIEEIRSKFPEAFLVRSISDSKCIFNFKFSSQCLWSH